MAGRAEVWLLLTTLIYNLNFSDLIPGINIRTPRTSIIGTDEFDVFIDRNKLLDVIHGNYSYTEIQEMFMKGELSYHLEKMLKTMVNTLNRPLAVRSSSLA